MAADIPGQREIGSPAVGNAGLLALVDLPHRDVRVVQIEPIPAGGPADLEVLEVLVVAEEAVDCLARVGGVRVGVREPADHEKLVRHHGAAGNSEALVGHCDRRRAGREDEVHEAGPRAGKRVDVDVVGHVHVACHQGGVALAEALAPVEVGQPQPLVAEGRLDQADVAELEAEAAGRNVADAMPMLDLPYESAGVARVPTHQIPRTEEPCHAARGVVLAGAVVRCQVDHRVIDSEREAMLVGQILFPSLVAVEERPLHLAVATQLVVDLVRPA